MNKVYRLLFMLCLHSTWVWGQTHSSEEVVRMVLQKNPTVRAATLEVEAARRAERAARGLTNPEVNVESPTGEFYAVGVQQSFEFPTVYGKQKQVAQAETELARANQLLSEQEVRFNVRMLYLEAQTGYALAEVWAERDTLYQQIKQTAIRQFEAGEIDALQKTRIELAATKINLERVATELSTSNALVTLDALTGIAIEVEPLTFDSTWLLPPSDVSANASVVYERQAALLAEKQMILAKNRNLPNFSVGYLNQGVRNSPIDYRFRASVGVPIWAGQNSALRQTAEYRMQAAQSRVDAQIQSLEMERQAITAEQITVFQQLDYYRLEAMPSSRDMIQTATRMRASGQIDYPTFLSTLDEAYQIKIRYIEQIKKAHENMVRMQYLSGR
jgi:outer membrane protein, heavy metal efflux system